LKTFSAVIWELIKPRQDHTPCRVNTSGKKEANMHEITINLHMHTCYSDGSGTHRDIARAAMQAGLQAVIVTDHNVWVQGVEGYYREGKKSVLVLVGEEIHDQDRDPQKNHLLVFGADHEMATLGDNPQHLIEHVRKVGGLSFIAHPIDPELSAFNESNISWVDWQVRGYTGIELWNGFSELKTVVRGKLDALIYVFFPQAIAHGPISKTLYLWDELLAQNQRVVAIGGSDAHARKMSLGPLHRVIFPYKFHFSAINTHVIIPKPLSGNLLEDRRMVFDALAVGHAFIGYDLPKSTCGFRFTAQGKEQNVTMGDELSVKDGVTLQVRMPGPAAECRLIKDGQVIRTWKRVEVCMHITTDPGIYRVEVYRKYLGMKRGWIFSNPIYIR
jgi:hypothetical protein